MVSILVRAVPLLAAFSLSDAIKFKTNVTESDSRLSTRDPGCTIFTLWDYKEDDDKKLSLFTRLTVEAWRRHSHGRCGEPIFITDANVRDYIPDMPDEYFHFPYAQAKSDMIRYALLYHHGGIYMDTDFLAVEDMDPIIDKLHSYDLVSYGDWGRGKDEDACDAYFSSNFMAGRKGSSYHKKVWERQKALVTNHCPLSEKPLEKVCCFDEPGEKCHIPWGGIGEGASHPVFLDWEKNDQDGKSYCFMQDRGFNPDHLMNVMEHRNQNVPEAIKFWNENSVPKPMDRMMYHLFNSLWGISSFSCKQFFDESTVLGMLFSKSFKTGHGSQPVPINEEAESFFSKWKGFRNTSKSYGDRNLPCEL
jgi:hypothetical protein